MLKRIVIVLVLVVGGFLAYAATRPDTYHVERSANINAPAAVVYGELEDFKNWQAWSPWEKRDPTMKKTYEGPAAGTGAIYSWVGNDKVGEGKMTLTDSKANSHVGIELEFLKPWQQKNTTDFTFETNPAGTQVRWGMTAPMGFMGKAFGLFKDMDQMIGPDFEKGLAQLKTLSEAEAKHQADAKKAAEANANSKPAAATP